MKSITEAGDLNGKRVLVRVDWSDGDEFRIKSSQPTLNYLMDAGANVVIATHIDVGVTDLNKFVPQGAELLPNLRDNPGEVDNTEEFAKELASKADIYVNDAFAVSHRSHASIVGVPKFLPSYAGFHLQDEVNSLSAAFHPERPFLFILGGAKFETKMPLVERFLNLADTIYILGANAKPAYETHLRDNPKVHFPHGDIAALDAYAETLSDLKFKIDESAFILWNGPLGKYEDGHTEGTQTLAQMIASSGKYSVVGGGDTLTAIKELGLFEKFTFVSTGGGAMLDFLASGTLPGIEALK